MDRRHLLAIAGSALLAGCGQDSDTTSPRTDRSTDGPGPSPASTATARSRPSARTSTTAASTTPAPTATPTRTPTATGSPTPGAATRTPSKTPTSPSPVEFSDRGSTLEEGLDIADGLTIVEGVYRGSGEFAVTFVPSDGGRARRLIDASGPYSGSASGLLDADTYTLDVVAERTYWRLTVRQPRPRSGRSLPVYLDRDDHGVFGPYAFGSDAATAAASHVGSGGFLVEVMDPTDEFPTVVFDREGTFTGETTFEPPDVGFVDVSTGGNWTLSMRDR